MIAPSTLKVASFLTPILTTSRYTLYEAPTQGYGEYVSIANRVAVPSQAALFALNRAWVRSGTQPDQRLYTRYDYPATSVPAATVVPGAPQGAACVAQGRTSLQGLLPGRIIAQVSCPADGTFVLKTTYHPQWQVTVDGVDVPTFMVSPSYIGISLPAGSHAIDAQYVATPIKTPLLILGWLLLVALFVVNRRFDTLADAIAARLRLPTRTRVRARQSGEPELVPEGAADAASTTAPGRVARVRAALAAAAPVPALVAVGGGLYVVLFLLQHAIYTDGSVTSPRPGPPERVTLELAAYVVVTIALFVVMGWLVVLARRGRIVGIGRILVLGAPIAIMAAYLVDRPAFSLDVLSYAAHGAIAAAGGNPYTDLPSTVAATTVGPQLTALGWLPPQSASPYGPLWTLVEPTVMQLTSNVMSAVLLFKIVAFLSTLGCARMVWLILGRVRPADQFLGTVLVVWNPLVIAELVGEGHNDAVMAFFTLVGLYATVRAWPARAVVGTALGGLITYLPFLLLPAQVVYLWRVRTSTRALLLGLIGGAAIAGVLAGIAFGSFWNGTDTFDGLARVGQAGPWPSVPGAFYSVLTRIGWPLDPGLTVTLIMGTIFLVGLAWFSWNIRDAAGLLGACARIALLYVLLVSPLYYPWYPILGVILLTLSPEWWSIGLIFIVSIAARLVAPLGDLRAAFLPVAGADHALISIAVAVSLTAFGLLQVYLWWERSSREADAVTRVTPSPEAN
jgi:hypothetical protein